MRISVPASAGVLVLVLVLLLFPSGCPPVSSSVRKVQDIGTATPASADPALRNETFGPVGPLPTASGQMPDQDALFSRVLWRPVATFDLKPGEVRVFQAAGAQPFTVFVRARWRGGAGPLSILVTGAGATVASGSAIQVEANRGVATAMGSISHVGSVDVSVRNTGRTSLHVQTVVGIL